MYSILMSEGTIIRDSDQKVVCPCQSAEDPDFLAYQAWAAEGNHPTEITPTPSFAEAAAMLQIVVQDHLDNTARLRGYDSILSLCTYVTSAIPRFKTEGQAGVDWRDACWAKCYEIMAAVQSGKRSWLTSEELLAELPVISWG
jgi:hypothetical protein